MLFSRMSDLGPQTGQHILARAGVLIKIGGALFDLCVFESAIQNFKLGCAVLEKMDWKKSLFLPTHYVTSELRHSDC